MGCVPDRGRPLVEVSLDGSVLLEHGTALALVVAAAKPLQLLRLQLLEHTLTRLGPAIGCISAILATFFIFVLPVNLLDLDVRK